MNKQKSRQFFYLYVKENNNVRNTNFALTKSSHVNIPNQISQISDTRSVRAPRPVKLHTPCEIFGEFVLKYSCVIASPPVSSAQLVIIKILSPHKSRIKNSLRGRGGVRLRERPRLGLATDGVALIPHKLHNRCGLQPTKKFFLISTETEIS